MAVTLRCELVQNSQNTSANTSNVTARVYAVSTGGSYNNYSSGSNATVGSITFGGSASGTYSFTHTFSRNTTTLIYSRTFDVTHNNDGTGNVTFSVAFDTKVSSGTIYGSASLTLTRIARASTPTVSGTLEFGGQITINTNRLNSSYTHNIGLVMVDADSGTQLHSLGVIANGVGASCTYTIPSSAAQYLPSDASQCKMNVSCSTYSGNTLIGSTVTSFIVSMAGADIPKITGSSVTDSKGYYNTYGAFIAGKSNISVSVTATPTTGATITMYRAYLDGTQVEKSTQPLNLGSPTIFGDRDIGFRVTDSRGRTNRISIPISVVLYTPPTVYVGQTRVNSSGVEDDEGTRMKISCSGSVCNINNKGTNYGTVTVKYRRSGTSTWTTASAATNRGQSWDFSITVSGLSASYTYEVEATVTDRLGETTTASGNIGTAKPILDFKAGGDGVGILTVSDQEGVKLGNNLYLCPVDTGDYFDQYDIYFVGSSGTPKKVLSILENGDVYFGLTGAGVPSTDAYADSMVCNSIAALNYRGAVATASEVMNINSSGIETLVDLDASFGLGIGEVSWSGLLGGYIGRQLWSGSWSAGSITVPNTVNYRVFIMATGGTPQEAMIGLRNQEGNRIYCFSLASPQDNVMYLNSGSFTVSSNKWTRVMPRSWGFSGTSINPNIVLYVTNIVGLI